MTWRQILTGHRSVVINTGAAGNGRQLGERLTGYLSAMLTFALREAISRTCGGWREQGRSVSVFADELALLAGSSAEVLTWLHDAGRSYGVRPYLATQRISQLPPALAESILDYGTVCWFAQSNPDVAERAARDLSVDGSDWSPADVTNLAPYTAVVRTHVGSAGSPRCRSGWRSSRTGWTAFAAAQGYPDRDGRSPDAGTGRGRPGMTSATAAPRYGVDDTPVPFADRPSACPDPDVTAARRLDPYWHGLWGDGSQASWLNRSLLERLGTDRVSGSGTPTPAAPGSEAITEILTDRRPPGSPRWPRSACGAPSPPSSSPPSPGCAPSWTAGRCGPRSRPNWWNAAP